MSPKTAQLCPNYTEQLSCKPAAIWLDIKQTKRPKDKKNYYT